VNYLKRYINKSKQPNYLPFVPIKGNTIEITSFGGATVVYAWIKGARNALVNHLMSILENDKQVKIFITNTKYSKEEMIEIDMKLVQVFQGKGTAPMTIYFYAKHDLKSNKNLERKKWKENILTTKLRETFRKKSSLKQMKNGPEKDSKIKEYLSTIFKNKEKSTEKRL